MSKLVPRAAQPLLTELAAGLRIVIVNGPRQAGKTTLLKEFQADRGGLYVTLDDPATLTGALRDPVGFVARDSRPLLIDEVQRGGDSLIRAIKMAADTSRDRGQFILSGSSRFLTIPTLSESLAGRAGFLDLWTLSVAERSGGTASFFDEIFRAPAAMAGKQTPWTRRDYMEVMVQGGYPELLDIPSPVTRRTWYDGYLSTVITRDISDFAQVHRLDALTRLLGLVSARSGSPAVLSDLARATELSRDSVRNYLAYLDMVFLTSQLPVWSTNLTTRVAKTPRHFVTDSGLVAHLLGLSVEDLTDPGHPAVGGLLETFVLAELTKLKSAGLSRVAIHHYRDVNNREIDFVLEAPRGEVVGIEVKASVSPGANAGRHLRWMRDRLGDRFVAGIILHLGPTAASFGERIFALPLSVLWGHAPPPK
jgi:predicted AAA+ superfamily ATPase